MKKSINEIDEESVIGFDALYSSMFKTKRGVLWKDSVAAFYHRGVERTDRLSEELHRGTYKASPPKHFMVTSPKPREIASIAYRDRVYQRSLNDNVIYPVMTKGFIYDNWACQTGKGTDPARMRLKQFLRKFYLKHGLEGYVSQFDIHGYYPNMLHSVAEENFRRKLPDWAFRRAVSIMKDQYDGDIGYNPGSQLIQIEGISLLNDLDHFIKEKLKVKYYIRYMDDLIMIHHDHSFLERCQQAVKDELAKLGFEVNPKKTRIYDLREGIVFLGFRFWLNETGKVVLTPDPDKIKTGRKKYRRLVEKSKRGLVPKENVDMSFTTWINHLSKGSSKQLIRRLTEYYQNLWKEGNESEHQTENNVSCGAGTDGECGSTGPDQ